MGDGARSVDDYEFRAARCGVIGHPIGCACGRGLLGPATSADLLELDAVPDPVDSDAPAAAYGATVGQGAVTTRHRRTVRP